MSWERGQRPNALVGVELDLELVRHSSVLVPDSE